MPRLFVAACFILIATTAHAQHPRLVFDAEGLAVLRVRYAQAPAGTPDAAAYADLVARADALLNMPPPTEPEAEMRAWEQRLEQLALAHLLTTGTSQARTVYASHAAAIAAAFVDFLALREEGWTPMSDLSRAQLSIGLALVYDWLYEVLTPAERQRLREFLLLEWQRQLSENRWLQPVAAPVTKVDEVERVLNNHFWVNNAALAFVGYGFDGESTYPDPNAFVQRAEANFDTVLATALADGASPEGLAHYQYGLVALLQYAKARQVYRRQDVVSENPHLQNAARYLRYAHFPDGEQLNVADTYYTPWWCVNGTLGGAIAGFINDPHAQQLAYEDVSTACPGSRANPVWQMLFYDEARPREPATALPLTHHFDQLGLVVSRTDWTPQAQYLAFKSGPAFAGHAHPDQNTFVLGVGGAKLIADHGYTYAKWTGDENTLLVRDPQSGEWNGQVREGNQFYYGGTSLQQRGLIENVLALDDRYLAVTAEARRVYPESIGLQQFRRDLIRLGTRHYVLHDFVRFEQPRAAQSRLHTRAGISYPGATHLRLEEAGETLQIQSRHDEGTSVFTETHETIPESLPPEPGLIPFTTFPNNSALTPYTDGRRIVSSGPVAEEHHFFQVLTPGEIAPEIKRETDGAARALQIEDAEATTHLLFHPDSGEVSLMRRTLHGRIGVDERDAEGRVRLTALHDGWQLRAGERVLLAADQPVNVIALYEAGQVAVQGESGEGTTLRLYLPSAPTGATASFVEEYDAEARTLRVDVPAGPFELVVSFTGETESVGTEAQAREVGVRFSAPVPNPFSESTQLRFYLPEASTVRLRVFDVLGREVAHLAEGMFTGGWHDVSFVPQHLPGGVYVCRLETKNEMRTQRVLYVR